MANDLLTWAEHYVRARDAFDRKLISIERKDDRLLTTFKNRSLTIFGRDKLSSDGTASGPIMLVTLQTPANLKILVDEFNTFAKNPELTIVFTNPIANERWIIKPHVHASIADKESLKTGLQAMYDTVQTV